MILVVDDDEIDVVVASRVLEQLEDQVDLRIAHDGQEALDILQSRDPVPPITLVLLDLNMHRMNGFVFLENLKRDDNLNRIAVFVMTSSWRRQDIERAYQFPIMGYIVKKEDDDYARDLLALTSGYLRLVTVV